LDRITRLFFEIHQDLPREGPGHFDATRRAYHSLPPLPEAPLILDMGCGPGRQSLDLHRLAPRARIVALDNHSPYLLTMQRLVRSRNPRPAVFPVCADMSRPGFRDGVFDVIWAEGSIYIMGFESGLRAWRRLMKPGGRLAVSEVAWRRPDPPPAATAFWQAGYPAIQDNDANLAAARSAGYDIVDNFLLPDHAWWDDYYRPLETRLVALRKKYDHDPELLRIIDDEQSEIDLFREYSAFYGYYFYTMVARD
jgi:SAM-dependent methyltransferase